MAIVEETVYTLGGKTYTRTKTTEKPGDAWISDGKGRWLKPTKPQGSYTWSDNAGWINKATTARKYGYTSKFINAKGNESLKAFFDQVWKAEKSGQEYTKEKFIAELKNTKWFTSKSEAMRNFAVLYATDPKEYKRQVDAREASMRDAAGKLGSDLSDDELHDAAVLSLQYGQNESEINDTLAVKIDYTTEKAEDKAGTLTGSAGDDEKVLRQWASDNGVPVGNDWVLRSVRSIASGDMNINDAKSFITNLAKKTYAAHAENITMTNSAKDAGAHYANIISSMMGVPSGEVNMSNPFMKQFMSQKNEKGNELDIPEAQKIIRSSDDWASGIPGREEILSVGNSILSKFGLG